MANSIRTSNIDELIDLNLNIYFCKALINFVDLNKLHSNIARIFLRYPYLLFFCVLALNTSSLIPSSLMDRFLKLSKFKHSDLILSLLRLWQPYIPWNTILGFSKYSTDYHEAVRHR